MTPTPMSNCSQGGTLLSCDNDDIHTMSLSSPAPVLEGARNCGSPKMQELLHDRRQRVNPYLPDPCGSPQPPCHKACHSPPSQTMVHLLLLMQAGTGKSQKMSHRHGHLHPHTPSPHQPPPVPRKARAVIKLPLWYILYSSLTLDRCTCTS
jgi:hypothetical protein